jgi:hypothetical protein
VVLEDLDMVEEVVGEARPKVEWGPGAEAVVEQAVLHLSIIAEEMVPGRLEAWEGSMADLTIMGLK